MKIKEAGYIVDIEDLPEEEKEVIIRSPSRYHVATAPAFKYKSDSTQARLALDGWFSWKKSE